MTNKKFWFVQFVFLVFLLGVFYLFITSKRGNVTSFDDCVKAGYPVMESYPRQCSYNGTNFIDEISPTPSSTNTSGYIVPGAQISEAATGARKSLAAELSVTEEDIAILEVLEKEWSDGCLGLGKPDESCLAALTPGYLVTLYYSGTEYKYRTGVDALNIRLESSTEVNTQVTM